MASSMTFNLDEAWFLEHYWQKKPLLIKNAIPGFQPPLQPEELAGLALEPEVESRIISHSDGIWQLQEGPFTDGAFNRSDLWTLLVQRVDEWVPEVAALRQCVNFLPRWRFDDVMVSYAVDGGGVGPHFDRYDVFLLQGQGQRLWRTGQLCDEDTPRIDHNQLHLLESFTTEEEYLLEPGDVLYVPPGIAHWGIAQGECMTYSLGFRAPPVAALVARLTDEVLDNIKPELLLEDRESLASPGRPGEITPAQIDNARQAVFNALEALDTGAWLAELVTDANGGPETDLEGSLDAIMPSLLPGPVILEPSAQVAWIDRQDGISVYAGGDSVDLAPSVIPLISRLCAGLSVGPLDADSGTNPASDFDREQHEILLAFLFSVGALINAD